MRFRVTVRKLNVTDGQTDRQTNERTNERTNGQTNKQTNGQTNKQTNKQTDGRGALQYLPSRACGAAGDN